MLKKLILTIMVILQMNTSSASNTKPIVVYTSPSGKMPYEMNASAYSIFSFAKSVYGSTIELDESYNMLPNIIDKWEWDFKEKKYVIQVNNKFEFHNKRKVNAADIEFMLMRSFLSTKAFQQNKWLQNIIGIKNLKEGDKYVSGMVKGIKVLSDTTLEIKLHVPNPGFMYLFSKAIPALKPFEELKEDLVAFKKLPIGAGNYRVVSVDENKGMILLERFDKNLPLNTFKKNKHPQQVEFYVKGNPVELKADIIMGSLDAYGDFPEEVTKQYTTAYAEQATAISVMNFNYHNDLGSNRDFREAVALLIKREAVFDQNNGRFPAYEVIPNTLWGRFGAGDEYDLKKAKEILSKIKIDKNKKLTFKFHGGRETPHYIKRLKDQFAEAGLDINFQVTNQPKLVKGEDDNVIGYIYGMPVDFADPLFLFSLYLKDSVKPFQRPEKGNEEFDKLYYEALETEDFKERNEKIKRLSKYFYENRIALPLASGKTRFSLSKKIKSLGRQPLGNSINLSNIEVAD